MPLIRFSLPALLFVLVWVYAHEYVADRLNRHSQSVQQKTDQLAMHLDWQLDAGEGLVGGLGEDWLTTGTGLSSRQKEPVLSLDFAEQSIDPALYDRLQIEWPDGLALAGDNRLKLEFSDQQQQRFYFSPVLPLTDFTQPVVLSEVLWYLVDDKGEHNGIPVPWSAMGPINGLVLRFYLADEVVVKLARVTLRQTALRQWLQPKKLSCEALLAEPVRCQLTNGMNHLDQMNNNGLSEQFISFTPYAAWPPVVWLVLAWLCALLLVWLLNRQPPPVVWVLISAVFVVIYVMHQPEVQWFTAYFRPLLLIGTLLLLSVYASRIWQFGDPAWPVLLSSLTVVVMAVVVWQLPWNFMLALPAYFVWALVQQTLLGPLFSDELQRHLGAGKWTVAWITGVLFAIIHAPNQALMLATLLGGVVWSYSWLTYRNIYVNALSHAMLALLFYAVSPDAWLGSARIGWFF
jgi:membrane protease YdiL (CAAX protease family)